jgi:hypothetical protein
MSAKQTIARSLAAAFLAGPWSRRSMVERAAQASGQRARWLSSLAGRVLTAFSGGPLDLDAEKLAKFISDDNAFSRRWISFCQSEHPRRKFWATSTMQPAPGPPTAWQVPPLATLGALADWLELKPGELDWLYGRLERTRPASPGPLSHYTYRWLAKAGGKARLLEMPKQRLKAIQRRLLHEILDRIPSHEAVHGYRRGRSVATYVAPHAGRRMVLHLDLRDFFPSVRAARVHALFATAGYPRAVARALTGLCTNVVPEEVLRLGPEFRSTPAHRQDEGGRLFFSPHLPQGAPTSPTLANLCAYRFDCRVAGLARSVGAQYTRYADDLAFSGDRDLERSARRFQVQVCTIALEEGFEVQTRKTRFMRQAIRQQIAGVVLNVHPNVRRSDYDTFKAILHNCSRHGPVSQNREGRDDFRAYLAGRIAFLQMISPGRGGRLREMFDRIAWTDAT